MVSFMDHAKQSLFPNMEAQLDFFRIRFCIVALSVIVDHLQQQQQQ